MVDTIKSNCMMQNRMRIKRILKTYMFFMMCRKSENKCDESSVIARTRKWLIHAQKQHQQAKQKDMTFFTRN